MTIDYFPLAEGGNVARGSERSAWWAMLPRNAGAATNGYMNMRAAVGSADVLPGLGSGGSAAGGFDSTLADGGFRRLQAAIGGGGGPVHMNPAGLTMIPAAMNAVSAFAPPAYEVLIFRELLQSFATGGALPASHQMLHGFTNTYNLAAAYLPPLTTGSWRGIAICERQNDVVLAVKNANPATLIPLPGVSLSATRQLIEHRLYAPKATTIGRYELWINQALVQVVNGDHPNFPRPLLNSEGFAFLMLLLNNGAGPVTAGFRSWWGEIITGPDSDGTY